MSKRMQLPAPVAIVAGNPSAEFRSKQLARDFTLPWINASDNAALAAFGYKLIITEQDPELVICDDSSSSEATNPDITNPGPKSQNFSNEGSPDKTLKRTHFQPHGPVTINFTRGRSAHRRRFGGGRNQPLARAVGIGKSGIEHILDATAGFGTDAFVIASLGCRVTLLERIPALAIMLEHAVHVARIDATIQEIAQRMSVQFANASIWLTDESNRFTADTVYLDPMYPQSNKHALAKKHMQALQAIAGSDTDSEYLLHAALSSARKRVVVKRPKGADALSGRAPDLKIASTNTRFDVYLTAT